MIAVPLIALLLGFVCGVLVGRCGLVDPLKRMDIRPAMRRGK